MKLNVMYNSKDEGLFDGLVEDTGQVMAEAEGHAAGKADVAGQAVAGQAAAGAVPREELDFELEMSKEGALRPFDKLRAPQAQESAQGPSEEFEPDFKVEIDEEDLSMPDKPPVPSATPVDSPEPRPFAKWDVLLVACFMILFALGGWVFYQRSTEGASMTRVVIDSQPALELKREAGALWAAGERLAALEKWQEAHQLKPENPDIRQSLVRAHVAVSTDYLLNGDPDSALPHLSEAHQVMPEEEAVIREYQALQAYIMGRDAVVAKDWGLAMEALPPLYNLDHAYLDVAELMEVALAGQQQSHLEKTAAQERVLTQARFAEPGRTARDILTLNSTELSNYPGQESMPSLGPFAEPGNKHIIVSINAQRMYVYENGQLIWNWTVSTGEKERPTMPGRYRIQSKFDNARSNGWELWMPYWQGVYWAGGSENGIHGQPVFDSGGRLWQGYLGTRITYGCVMLSDANAAALYNWTQIGTPISIHWDWQPTWVPDHNGDPI